MSNIFDTNEFLREQGVLDESAGMGTGLSVEDPENNKLICEAAIRGAVGDMMFADLLESTDAQVLVDEGILSEKTIVKFDKYAKLNRATSTAVIAIAKEKNDRDYKKLVTCWKMRKILLNKLWKKYGNMAKQRARQQAHGMSKSKSSAARSIAKKVK